MSDVPTNEEEDYETTRCADCHLPWDEVDYSRTCGKCKARLCAECEYEHDCEAKP